jgi:hypothetical protein
MLFRSHNAVKINLILKKLKAKFLKRGNSLVSVCSKPSVDDG